jgi:hypothetical protein
MSLAAKWEINALTSPEVRDECSRSFLNEGICRKSPDSSAAISCKNCVGWKGQPALSAVHQNASIYPAVYLASTT